MPQFVITCVDKPNSIPLRMANREEHLAYLRSFMEQIIGAGPSVNDMGEPTGSILVMEFADKGAAEKFCADDPYAKAGLFDSVTIVAWKKVLPPA